MDPPESLRLYDHAGRLYLHIPESIPPQRILDTLRTRFAATELSRLEDPLGDWIDIRLAISGQELTLTVAYYGIDLWASTPAAAEALRQVAGPLAEALQTP